MDRFPWSTGRYREKPDSAPSNNRICAGKSLISRDVRAQIPYAAEQRNQSDEQGDKTDDQGIKSAEHGKAPQVRTGRLWWAEWDSLGCGRRAFSISAITLATMEVALVEIRSLRRTTATPEAPAAARLTAARATKAWACDK